MDSREIYNCLKKCSIFYGVFALDQLPKINPFERSYFLIVNLDKSWQVGSHWIAIFIRKAGCKANDSFYFDSYGLYPQKYEIENYLNRYTVKWTYNQKKLQSLLTDTCGYYCIILCRWIASGKHVSDFLKIFSYNPLLNDVLICKMYSKRNCSAAKKGQFCKAMID